MRGVSALDFDMGDKNKEASTNGLVRLEDGDKFRIKRRPVSN